MTMEDTMSSEDRIENVSLLLQRLDFLADRPADHPKYFAAIAADLLALSLDEVVAYLVALDVLDDNARGTDEDYAEVAQAIVEAAG